MSKYDYFMELNEIKKEQRKIPFNVQLDMERYEAYKETQGREGKHKYCNHCWACEKHVNCIATKKQRYAGNCYQAKKRYLLKKEGLYGTETNRLTREH